jgi:CheY-like chemotaxis protein
MVHGLAMQSGGGMAISSRLGEGTTVDLWLPLSKSGGDVPRGAPTLPAASGYRGIEPRKVLVVDDDPLVSLGTVEMLVDLGHEVVAASSGEEALKVLTSSPGINFVITDHSMPGMTGLELARAIRSMFPEMLIVLASGYAELPNTVREAIDVPRLAKPYRQYDLASIMAELCKPLQSNVVPLRA